MSDRKPELWELALALNTLSWSEVKLMAVQLRMEYFRLQHIEQQNTAVTDRLLSAMDMWLNNDARATWARIIKALNDTDKSVLAKEIEQKYCQPLEPPHTTTARVEESTTNLPPMCSNPAPLPVPPTIEDLFSPISLAASEYSLPSPPHIHISDFTKVSSPSIPAHTPASLHHQASSQPTTDSPLPIFSTSECSLPTFPPTMSVDSANGDTPVSLSEQSQPQPLSSPTQSRKRKCRNSPTLPISPSPSSLPQPPPQPPQLNTTQPQELPGWQPTVVRESKQKRIRMVKQEASKLRKEFVSVLTHTEVCFSENESESFHRKLKITLKNLPLSDEFEHLKFLEDKCDAIERANSVSEIFDLLRPYWNYTDFALLHHLVEKFGDDNTKVIMKTYISSLESFEKRTTIQDYEDATGERKEVPQHFIEAAFEVQRCKDPSEYTLYDVRQIVESLAQQSSLELYVPMIKKARIGSLVITIALPPPALGLLQQALHKEFLDTLNIVSVRNQCRTPMKIFCRECLQVTTFEV